MSITQYFSCPFFGFFIVGSFSILTHFRRLCYTLDEIRIDRKKVCAGGNDVPGLLTRSKFEIDHRIGNTCLER
jgi:hypothetical protein